MHGCPTPLVPSMWVSLRPPNLGDKHLHIQRNHKSAPGSIRWRENYKPHELGNHEFALSAELRKRGPETPCCYIANDGFGNLASKSERPVSDLRPVRDVPLMRRWPNDERWQVCEPLFPRGGSP